MSQRKRIAIAGFMHESNTFNPLYADREAFAAQSLTFGPQMAEEWREAHHEVGAFLEAVEQHGGEAIPLVMAWATPSGPVRDEVYEEITGYLVQELQKQKPAGLLLALHGAMVTESHLDGDGETVARLRAAMGPDFPIVVTLDFHGNISRRLVDNCQAAVAYRTCPHVDQRECGHRAANIMRRILDKQLRPRQALVKPPLIINIMAHDTSSEPLQAFMDQARFLEQNPGILAVSLLAGFYYADVPAMGPSIIVVNEGDALLAQKEAHEIGDPLWRARSQMAKHLPSVETAVRLALQERAFPVVLVDTGDNVGGGSAGDGTFVLAELLKQNATRSVVCLYAPEDVQQCIAVGVGQPIQLTVGGKVDRLHGEPISVIGRVKLIHDGNYVESEIRHGGKRINHMGVTAVVELAGENLLVLNSLRHPPFSLGQLTCLGIQPERQRILVVKAAIAYKAAYGPIAKKIIEVDTPGLTAVNPARFSYQHIRRPLYPLS